MKELSYVLSVELHVLKLSFVEKLIGDEPADKHLVRENVSKVRVVSSRHMDGSVDPNYVCCVLSEVRSFTQKNSLKISCYPFLVVDELKGHVVEIPRMRSERPGKHSSTLISKVYYGAVVICKGSQRIFWWNEVVPLDWFQGRGEHSEVWVQSETHVVELASLSRIVKHSLL